MNGNKWRVADSSVGMDGVAERYPVRPKTPRVTW